MAKKIDPRLYTYDWKEAFVYAANKGRPVLGYEGDLSGFTRADIARIVALDEGVADELDWIILMKLRDGRVAFLEAGCDYTGWDCQAGGGTVIGDDLKHLVRYGIDEVSRTRLGFGADGRRLPKKGGAK